MSVRIKRVYDEPSDDDGLRILVDRLWPRGLAKARAALTCWMKDAAPSPALRIWFAHDPARFEKFSRRYLEELRTNAEALELRRLSRKERVTLLYGARDPKINHAIVLASFVRARTSSAPGSRSGPALRNRPTHG